MSKHPYVGFLPSGAQVQGTKQAIQEMHAQIWRAQPDNDCTGQSWRDYAERADRARADAETRLAEATKLLGELVGGIAPAPASQYKSVSQVMREMGYPETQDKQFHMDDVAAAPFADDAPAPAPEPVSDALALIRRALAMRDYGDKPDIWDQVWRDIEDAARRLGNALAIGSELRDSLGGDPK